MTSVARGGCSVGSVGGGKINVTVLDVLVFEQLLDLGWSETEAVVSLSLVESRHVGARDTREALRQTTCTGCMASNGVVYPSVAIVIGVKAIGEGGCRLKAEEEDKMQADKHQLECGLKGDHGEGRAKES